MWSLQTEDFQVEPPAIVTAVKGRVNRFFKLDVSGYANRHEVRPHRSRQSSCWPSAGCREQIGRGVSFCIFFCGCMGSLAQQSAPWLLAVLDFTVHFIMYCLVPNTLLDHLVSGSHYHYSFRISAEDILFVSLARVAAVSLTSCSGVDRFRRPYLVASIGCALTIIPFLITKAVIFKYHGYWWWAVTMLIFSLVFCIAHVLCAVRVVELARRRYSEGLMGFNIQSWEEGEEAWLNVNAAGRPSPLADSEHTWQHAWTGDVLPEALADVDSRFIKLSGITVHYKLEDPEEPNTTEMGIVLVHGFGAGLFSWRHIMRSLAQQTGCRVVAFDRPAFGLTARPAKLMGVPNPYSSKFQAGLMLQLCSELKLRRVVLVGHSDGGLLALMAAAASCRADSGSMEPPDTEERLAGEGWRGSSAETAEPFNPAGRGEGSSASQSCLETTLRSCAGSGPSATKGALSQPTLRHSRSGDHSSAVASAMDADDLESGVQGKEVETMAGWAQDRNSEELDRQYGGGPWLGESALVQHGVRVVGLAMLHPSLEGETKPKFMRLLGKSRVGRRIMRPLLRTEIGEVASRRAWCDPDKLTKEVLDLYKRPLCVQGWDTALVKLSQLKQQEVGPVELMRLFAEVASVPTLVAGGEHDRVISRRKVLSIHEQLPGSSCCLLPMCGHLSHEECPAELMLLLTTLVAEAFQANTVPTLSSGGLPRLSEDIEVGDRHQPADDGGSSSGVAPASNGC